MQDVETDEVTERERPHGVSGSEFHPVVDVLAAGETVFEHPHRGHEIGDQQEVDDETGTVFRHDCLLTEPFDEQARLLDRFVAGIQGVHDLDQAHDRDR